MKALGMHRTKVIYMGLPMVLEYTPDGEIPMLYGFWSWVPLHLFFNGVFMTYEGSYLKALWTWMFGDWDGEAGSSC